MDGQLLPRAWAEWPECSAHIDLLILSGKLHLLLGHKYTIVLRRVKSKRMSSILTGSGREESSFLILEPSKMLMVLVS